MARLLLQFADYRGSGSHKTGAAAAATLLVKNGDIPCCRTIAQADEEESVFA
jgi:hypothetical protein